MFFFQYNVKKLTKSLDFALYIVYNMIVAGNGLTVSLTIKYISEKRR